MKNIFFYDMVIGKIGIADNGRSVTELSFFEEKLKDGNATSGPEFTEKAVRSGELAASEEAATIMETALIKKAAEQIKEYLAGRRKTFDLPIEVTGTPFQKDVWNALRAIPYGETRSYKEIAEAVGRPKACRAVGMANNKNPLALIIPCHRVIGADGKLVGFGGGLDIKKRLLDLEKKTDGLGK